MSDTPDMNWIAWQSAPMPLFYCMGKRPTIFTLTADHIGWTTCLLFTRNGDTALLPIIQQFDPRDRDDDNHHNTMQTPSTSETVTATCADLKREGWILTGRLTLNFVGMNYGM